MSVKYLTVKCPCGETSSTGTGKVCRNGITKPMPDDPSDAETQTFWDGMADRMANHVHTVHDIEWHAALAMLTPECLRCGRPRRRQCEQGAGAQGRQCLQHHPRHPSDCQHGAWLVRSPISSMISTAALSPLILHGQQRMHWWHCGMRSRGCCNSGAEQYGTFSIIIVPFFHELCDEHVTRCGHDTLVQQPGCRWRGGGGVNLLAHGSFQAGLRTHFGWQLAGHGQVRMTGMQCCSRGRWCVAVHVRCS